MNNYAGYTDKDYEIAAELTEAGIQIIKLNASFRSKMGEVQTIITGGLHGWFFERAWNYWKANGPGIPPSYATPFHNIHGHKVRVAGNCTCPSPIEWYKGFGVPSYHIDTQQGLNEFAKMLNKIVEEAKQ